MAKILTFLKGLICGNDGKPSLMDTGFVLLLLLFAGTSIYLVCTGREWVHYDRFSDMTVGSGGMMKAFKYGANVANGIWGKKEEGNNEDSSI